MDCFLRSSIRTFLISAKAALRTAIDNQQRIKIVLGNESADLDSITSSILYAYLRSLSAPCSGPPYVPLLNIPRCDVLIRPELLYLLPHANLDPSHLITLNDLYTPSSTGVIQDAAQRTLKTPGLIPENTFWILVDHNNLQPPFSAQFAPRVIGCIDHHEDEHIIPSLSDGLISEPRIIEKCGSCTSLVIQYFRDSWDALSSSSSAISGGISLQSDASGVGVNDVDLWRKWDEQVAKLALASILVDTQNLTDKGKVTPQDEKAVLYLEAKIQMVSRDGSSFGRHQFFNGLSDAKRNLDGLKLGDVLRKDYKQWVEKGGKLGISCVVKPLEFIMGKAVEERRGRNQDEIRVFRMALEDFARSRDLDICAVMTTSTSGSGSFQRELLIMSVKPSGNAIVESFATDAGKELGLERWMDSAAMGGGDEENINAGIVKVWWQTELSKSRKQVAPLLREALRR